MQELEHFFEKISRAKVETKPFSYFFIEKVFPEDFYHEIIQFFPESEHFRPISSQGVVKPGTYKQRLCVNLDMNGLSRLPFFYMLFWNRLADALKNKGTVSKILDLFSIKPTDLFPDLSLVSDHSDYAIGPHTDHPQKVATLLFYMPKDDRQKELGTSIYEPIDPNFRCAGFQHHPFENFRKIYTAPFIPNSLFGFLKSDCSFHGVEPIGKQERPRNLMSYQFLTQ